MKLGKQEKWMIGSAMALPYMTVSRQGWYTRLHTPATASRVECVWMEVGGRLFRRMFIRGRWGVTHEVSGTISTLLDSISYYSKFEPLKVT
jgi:hypothetical protein